MERELRTLSGGLVGGTIVTALLFAQASTMMWVVVALAVALLVAIKVSD